MGTQKPEMTEDESQSIVAQPRLAGSMSKENGTILALGVALMRSRRHIDGGIKSKV
jgi:hypothetical protein